MGTGAGADRDPPAPAAGGPARPRDTRSVQTRRAGLARGGGTAISADGPGVPTGPGAARIPHAGALAASRREKQEDQRLRWLPCADEEHQRDLSSRPRLL